MSSTYTLNDTTPSDIGGIIGKGASGLKKVISESWNMYDTFQRSDQKIEEPKPTLRIRLNEDGESVIAEITSESESMRKFAKNRLDKGVSDFHSKKSLRPHTFLAELPHHLLGKVIGNKARNLKRVLDNAIKENRQISIHEDDVETAETARLRIVEKSFNSTQDLIDSKKGNGILPSSDGHRRQTMIMSIISQSLSHFILRQIRSRIMLSILSVFNLL